MKEEAIDIIFFILRALTAAFLFVVFLIIIWNDFRTIMDTLISYSWFVLANGLFWQAVLIVSFLIGLCYGLASVIWWRAKKSIGAN